MLKDTFYKIHKENFKKLFHSFYRKPYITKEIAEDLVSETFLRGYKYSQDHELENEVEITKVIYGISKNIYKEWVSKNINLAEVEFCEEISEIQDELTDYAATDNFEARQDKLIGECLTIIETFSNNLKQVMKYRFIDGLTRAETAKLLNISEDAVHTYQKRGVKYIKERLKMKTSNT